MKGKGLTLMFLLYLSIAVWPRHTDTFIPKKLFRDIYTRAVFLLSDNSAVLLGHLDEDGFFYNGYIYIDSNPCSSIKDIYRYLPYLRPRYLAKAKALKVDVDYSQFKLSAHWRQTRRTPPVKPDRGASQAEKRFYREQALSYRLYEKFSIRWFCRLKPAKEETPLNSLQQ